MRAVLLLLAPVWFAQAADIPLDHPAIQYVTRPVDDPVSRLNRKMQTGEVEFRYEPNFGYLRSLLEALNIPIESQIAVFSKTSVQALRIGPDNPRMLFFNDSVVVGWVRHGGSMEIVAQDPAQGISFYTLDQRAWVHDQIATNARARDASLFKRRTDCLHCHISSVTFDIPGTLIRSVFPSPDGTPLEHLGSTFTDLRTPFSKVWGGWYVTGSSGKARHMGNATVNDPSKPESMVTSATVNLDSLRTKLDTSAYLSPYSDIVALMVFEHQTHMMNLLARMAWETQVVLYENKSRDIAVRLQPMADELVDYLLFIDEPALTDPIQGASGFAAKFAQQGPRDSHGRSLRQFDLQHRLMRYPCSYMIYSDAFTGLPPQAKQVIYQRLWQILSGRESGSRYAHLRPSDRQAVLEILRQTKKDLPEYFNATLASSRH